MPRTKRVQGCDWAHHGDTGTVIWVASSSTTTGCTVTTGDIWTTWVQTAYSGTITSNATVVWDNWNRHPMVAHAQAVFRDQLDVRLGNARGRVSPEERARRDAEDRLAQEAWEAKEAARKEANRKAEVLLRSCLTQQQIDDLEKKKCFFLHTGGKRYRIDRGQHGNVKLLDDRDRVVESYCIQPKGGLPDADAMLAQKLLLETDPESFRRISNVTIGGRVMPGIQAPPVVFHLPPLPNIELQPLPRLAL